MKIVCYNPAINFPRVTWTISIDPSIPRELAPSVCEQLHAIMSEKQGASFYYPDVVNKITTCRYEWPHKWKNRKHGLHLGLVFCVKDENLKELSVYVTTSEAIQDNFVELLPQFPKGLLSQLQQETLHLFQEAIQRLAPLVHQERRVILYLDLHPQMGVASKIETEDKRIVIFPSAFFEGTIISPVSVTVSAASNQGGRPKALHEIVLFCALYTLANGLLCQTTELKWSRKRPPIEFIDALDDFDIESLYPPRCKSSSTLCDQRAAERINTIWMLYHRLSEEKQERFLPALFAYYSAQNINHKYSTLAIVAYIAALGSLAKGAKEKCDGQITCSSCGSLKMKHDKVGDTSAIILLIKDLLKLTDAQGNELEEIVKRAYNKQRSAFVHAAELRHEEFHQKFGLPASFPTTDDPFRDVLTYKQDFLSIERITRRVLLEWLCREAGITLDLELFRLADVPLKARVIFEGSITLPAQTTVAPFHNGKVNIQKNNAAYSRDGSK
jgi:hypothetical protein